MWELLLRWSSRQANVRRASSPQIREKCVLRGYWLRSPLKKQQNLLTTEVKCVLFAPSLLLLLNLHKVIHPLTIEQINRRNIPLRLKNVKNPKGSGTIIYPSTKSPTSGSLTATGSNTLILAASDPSSSLSRSMFMTANGYHGDTQYRRTPTAITAKEAVTVINVQSNGRSKPHAFLGEISERLGRHNLTIDLISSSQHMVSLAVPVGSSITSIDEAVNELSEVGIVTVERHMCIVSVVGHKMRNIVGVAGEVFGALARARVNVHLISQGASEINISFVVRAQDVLLAMDVVHTNVIRIPVQSEQENTFIKGSHDTVSYHF